MENQEQIKKLEYHKVVSGPDTVLEEKVFNEVGSKITTLESGALNKYLLWYVYALCNVPAPIITYHLIGLGAYLRPLTAIHTRSPILGRKEHPISGLCFDNDSERFFLNGERDVCNLTGSVKVFYKEKTEEGGAYTEEVHQVYKHGKQVAEYTWSAIKVSFGEPCPYAYISGPSNRNIYQFDVRSRTVDMVVGGEEPRIVIENDKAFVDIPYSSFHKRNIWNIKVPEEIELDASTIVEYVEDEKKFIFLRIGDGDVIHFGEMHWTSGHEMSSHWALQIDGWYTGLPVYHKGTWHVPLSITCEKVIESLV